MIKERDATIGNEKAKLEDTRTALELEKQQLAQETGTEIEGLRISSSKKDSVISSQKSALEEATRNLQALQTKVTAKKQKCDRRKEAINNLQSELERVKEQTTNELKKKSESESALMKELEKFENDNETLEEKIEEMAQ
eukprot:CAMPEP_0174270694 /NCGR_PEP_ID=MMETSP0439-20130205/45401_1 /TAXON_ID=0 /ORGANISM="Stereomyxa ramosa, Strain Chinc5" /LENGTH=138 /DNA_ID=CAMNT_0015360179 /DNA_START=29 /DNA_END=442 /DNA_ORIENTATION=+